MWGNTNPTPNDDDIEVAKPDDADIEAAKPDDTDIEAAKPIDPDIESVTSDNSNFSNPDAIFAATNLANSREYHPPIINNHNNSAQKNSVSRCPTVNMIVGMLTTASISAGLGVATYVLSKRDDPCNASHPQDRCSFFHVSRYAILTGFFATVEGLLALGILSATIRNCIKPGSYREVNDGNGSNTRSNPTDSDDDLIDNDDLFDNDVSNHSDVSDDTDLSDDSDVSELDRSLSPKR